MGVAASTNVKEIKIDQTDDKWDKIQNPSGKKRGFSISKRWVSSADNEGSSNRRQRQLSSSLEAAEKRAVEAEQRARQLEREVGTLELRNMELAEEVTWLKKQLSDRPEVPMLSRPSTGSNRNKDIADENRNSFLIVAKLEEQIKRYEDEILKLKTKINKDTQRLQAELEDQKHNHDREMRSVDNHLMRANRLNEIYEEAIQKKLSCDVLADLKNRATDEFYPNANSKLTDASLTNGNKSRAQLILELSEQISKQKDKIRYLENDIVKRDLEIGHMKELMTTSEAMLHASLNASSSSALKKLSTQTSVDQQQNYSNSGNKRPVAFSASRRHSATVNDNSKPLKVDYSKKVKGRDEIENLLKSPPANPEHQDVTFDLITSTTKNDRGINNNAKEMSDDDDSPGSSSKVYSKRTVPAPKKLPVMTSSSLKNVYALSDDLEPLKVHESPSVSRMSIRPKTAAGKFSGQINGIGISELDELIGETDQQSASAAKPITPGTSRTHSAPMLFKPRPASKGSRRMSRPEPDGHVTMDNVGSVKKRAEHKDTTDIMSLNDVDINNKADVLKIAESEEADDSDVITYHENFNVTDNVADPVVITDKDYMPSKPPRPSKRPNAGNPGSAASVYSSSALGSGEDNEETSDEEIRRLLDKRNGRQNAYQRRSGGVGGSAKSRDSGFLNESYTSAQSTNMWTHENVTPQ